MLQKQLFAPGSSGQQLRDQGSISRLLAEDSWGARVSGLLTVIEILEALRIT
ncbi:MAG: hypothetical protein WAM11_09155 [Cyanobium sp.]